jgi:hypothetical protein
MLRIQAPTAFKDVTFNNVKASRSSINDLYTQSITRIDSNRQIEVFSTLTNHEETIRTLREQNTALLQRLTALEQRVNELTIE